MTELATAPKAKVPESKRGIAKNRSEKTSLSNADNLMRSGSCACGGGCPSCQKKSNDIKISQPADAAEIEADKIADNVMRMPNDNKASVVSNKNSSPTIQRKCSTCEDDEKIILRKPIFSSSTVTSQSPAHVSNALSSAGRPLDNETRNFFEPRMGRNFGNVRVHTNTDASYSAKAVNANAYTLGSNIVFASGEYKPDSDSGRRLLAHELAHVIQGGSQNAILKRQPDTKGAQAAEAQLRVRIVDALEATKRSAVDALVSAIERGDRAYLEGLGLTSKQVDHLLNRTPQFEMMFGNAAELAVEQVVRTDPFLSEYVKRGPQGRVPRGVGKPDWRIETPSSSIAVDLMTPEQVAKKLEMWSKQWKRGRPKWYVEKGLNVTYNRPPNINTSVPVQTPLAAPKISYFRTAGRFLAREAPGLALQAVLMIIFPPGVNIHNDRAEELSRLKLDPAIQDALSKQEPAFEKLQADDFSKSIYANVTARLDYAIDASRHGDLELFLKDVTFLGVKITNEDIVLSDSKFNDTGSKNAAKQITYSILLYEPEFIIRDREWAQVQQQYQECIQRYGTGYIPHSAGVEEAQAAQRNPEDGPCIPPHMKMMEGP